MDQEDQKFPCHVESGDRVDNHERHILPGHGGS